MNYPVTFAVLFLASFCLAPMSGAAQTDSLAGEYGHNYTEKDGTPVWEVRQKGDTYELLSLGTPPSSQEVHVLTADERRHFWQTMWWSEESSAQVNCIGNTQEVICFVPATTRQTIAALKENDSDYFYYDPTGGLMEIQKLPQ